MYVDAWTLAGIVAGATTFGFITGIITVALVALRVTTMKATRNQP
jgi:tetrahydromethanopterin S-methyltransferase subunit B